MEAKDILKMIETAFDNHISSSATETVLGIESYVEGKEDFYKELKEKLLIMFNDETLE